MARRQGAIHQFYWAEMTAADFKRQKGIYPDPPEHALVFSTQPIKEADIVDIVASPYGRNSASKLRPCSDEEENIILPEEHSCFYLNWVYSSGISNFVKQKMAIPDTISMTIEQGRSYSGYYCHFKTLKNGQIVTIKKKLPGVKNTLAEVEDAIAWAVKKAPAPPTDTEVMVSPLVNAMLALASDRALYEMKNLINGPLSADVTHQSGSRFASTSITAVSIRRRTGHASPMAEIEIDGKHRVVEDGQGYTVELKENLSDVMISGLPESTLGKVIDAVWAQGLKIRTATRILADPIKNIEENIRLRVERTVEPLVMPIKGKPVDFVVELARVTEKARKADIKFSQSLIYAMQQVAPEDLIAMIDMCANSNTEYLDLDAFGLKDWKIKREYGRIFEIWRSPSCDIDELVQQFEALNIEAWIKVPALAA